METIDTQLKEILVLKRELRQLKSKISKIKLYTSPGYEERISGGISANQIEENYYLREELLKSYKETKERKEKKLKQLYDTIDLIEEGEPRLVLKMYYVDGLSLEKIAVQLGYSFRTIIRKKKRGLRILKEMGLYNNTKVINKIDKIDMIYIDTNIN